MGKKRTDDELAEISSHYDILKEFRKKEPITYQLICKRGLAGKLLKHMERGHREDLSDEDLAEITSSYDSLSEFQKEDHTTYSIICNRGLLDKLCGHMKRQMSKHRSNDELAEIASHYGILKDFRENEPSVYAAILKRGLFSELCGNMKRQKGTLTVSDEELAERASRYDMLRDFVHNDNSAYRLIKERGLFQKLCGRMKRMQRDLTNELIAEIAKGFHSRKEFMEADSSAYSTACKRGIIDKVCEHMERLATPAGYWTKELCRERAMDYNSRNEFKEAWPAAYGAAYKAGWLDDICSHMVPKGNRFKRKIYAFTFSDGYAYIGLAQDPSDRYRSHVSGKERSSVYEHIKESGATYEFAILTDWLHKDVAGKVEEEYRQKYATNGWKMLNRMKCGALGGYTKKYTDEKIRQERDKYEYVDDFRNGSPLCYKYILRHKLWDKYCGQMKMKVAPKNYWTLERAINVAQEVKYRSELRGRYNQAYNLLNKAGLLDVYFPERKKMPKREKIWTLEKSMTVVSLCRSRYQLQKEHPGAYITLRDAGLLDKYFPTNWVRPFTDEERAGIIASCRTRTELHNRHKSIYDDLRRNGLLDEYFPLK